MSDVKRSIIGNMNLMIMSNYIYDEVVDALKGMGPKKAIDYVTLEIRIRRRLGSRCLYDNLSQFISQYNFI